MSKLSQQRCHPFNRNLQLRSETPFTFFFLPSRSIPLALTCFSLDQFTCFLITLSNSSGFLIRLARSCDVLRRRRYACEFLWILLRAVYFFHTRVASLGNEEVNKTFLINLSNLVFYFVGIIDDWETLLIMTLQWKILCKVILRIWGFVVIKASCGSSPQLRVSFNDCNRWLCGKITFQTDLTKQNRDFSGSSEIN